MRYSERRGHFWPGKVLFFVAMAILFALALGTVVMWLWNAILPDVVGAKPLNFWQALGLLVLSRILFGGFRFGPSGRRGPWAAKRRHWKEKWRNMSPEERAKFREKWRQSRHCGTKNDQPEE